MEAILDIAHHVISDEGYREPGSYADAFVVLAENGVISAETARNGKLMAKFRDRLVHYYETVDPEQVFNIFAFHLDDFDHFLMDLRTWLAQHDCGPE